MKFWKRMMAPKLHDSDLDAVAEVLLEDDCREFNVTVERFKEVARQVMGELNAEERNSNDVRKVIEKILKETQLRLHMVRSCRCCREEKAALYGGSFTEHDVVLFKAPRGGFVEKMKVFICRDCIKAVVVESNWPPDKDWTPVVKAKAQSILQKEFEAATP